MSESRSKSPPHLLLFLVTCAGLGFFAGTFVLMGPVRWLTSYTRAHDWSLGSENALVRTVIVVLVVGVVIVSWRLSGWALAAANARWQMIVPGGAIILALSALALWMNPRMMIGVPPRLSGADTAQFVFGSYPDEATMRELKQKGYTAVVTLLHPAVVPFEPKLLADERRLAEKIGMTLVEAPMLPWVGRNESSLNTIRALASQKDAHYYVHCYLGKDRVNVVRRALAAVHASVAATEAIGSPRRLLDIGKFERGPVIHLGDSVFVIPFPTDEEWFGYLASGWVKSVVSLLDAGDPGNAAWLKKEAIIAQQYQVRVDAQPIAHAGDRKRLAEIVAKVRGLPRPVAVHGFLVPSAETDAFIAAWRDSTRR